LNACRYVLSHFIPLPVSLHLLRLSPHPKPGSRPLPHEMPVADPERVKPLICRRQQQPLTLQPRSGSPQLAAGQALQHLAEPFAARQLRRLAASATAVAASTEQHPAVEAAVARAWSALASECDGGTSSAPVECPRSHDRSRRSPG
jgi:hypothetical protein